MKCSAFAVRFVTDGTVGMHGVITNYPRKRAHQGKIHVQMLYMGGSQR